MIQNSAPLTNWLPILLLIFGICESQKTDLIVNTKKDPAIFFQITSPWDSARWDFMYAYVYMKKHVIRHTALILNPSAYPAILLDILLGEDNNNNNGDNERKYHSVCCAHKPICYGAIL